MNSMKLPLVVKKLIQPTVFFLSCTQNDLIEFINRENFFNWSFIPLI